MSTANQPKAQRRLAAIVSADVVGYSSHMAADDEATVQALQSHRETMRGSVREHRGRVVDAVGDNMLAEFQSAVDAVNCALDVQHIIGERIAKSGSGLPMQFRMGIHIGDLLVDGEQIFGDGINIAARLESMAPAGGICASGAVVEQVRGKVAADFRDLGAKELKNIAQPVKVWQVTAEAAEDKPAAASLSVAGFGGRPAIAVLPFHTSGDDAEQELLADGIVEDVTAGLSAYRLFPVIARGSTIGYRGKDLDARRIGAELGARYVVCGSVRQAGRRVRVTTELIDSKSGHQIQAERFDREAGDVFDLQDDIVAALIGSIEPALGNAEARRVSKKPTESLDAWENLQQGYSLMLLGNPEKSRQAKEFLRRAVELDPEFAAAHAALSLLLWMRAYLAWEDDLDATTDEARTHARRAVALDPEHPRAHEAMGWQHWFDGDANAAVRSFERAIELNPSLATAWWALASALSEDRPDEALVLAQKAVRLSPKDRAVTLALHACAICAFHAGHYEEAVEWERQSIEHPALPASYRLLGAALGHLGRIEEARAAIDEATRRAPKFTLSLLRSGNSPKLVERLVDGWAKAGWEAPP